MCQTQITEPAVKNRLTTIYWATELWRPGDYRIVLALRYLCGQEILKGEQPAKLELVINLKTYLGSIENLQTTGRNGLHMYNNQDHSMLTAMLAVKNILGEKHDLWQVNTERSYHEEIRIPASSPFPGVTPQVKEGA